MKQKHVYVLLSLSMLFSTCSSSQDNTEPWATGQLIEPMMLAKTLNDEHAAKPLIYSIGPAGLIRDAVDIGEGKNADNINRLRKELEVQPKDAGIVIYCGCCPFKNCPNIRPAFSLLNEMGFVNHKLLNLSKNLKVDWIDRGYPMSE